MAINPTYTSTLSFVDRSGESSSFTVHTSAAHVTAGNGDAGWQAVLAALVPLTEGGFTRDSFNQSHRISNISNSEAGQREHKYLVTYEDTTTLAKYSFEIPCRNPSVLPPERTDEFDMSAGDFPALVTALEAYCKSPDGNGINVVSIRLMGKNT